VRTSPAEPDISPVPDTSGHFGSYGGLFAPESLMAAIEQLAKEYEAARADPEFTAELNDLLKNYAARPTLVTEAKRFGNEFAGGATVLLKREDLAHTGSHKINNVLGQVLLTKHGQDPGDRGDRRRPARRGDRDGVRAVRP
jgi:tryptophan synthase beta chain